MARPASTAGTQRSLSGASPARRDRKSTRLNSSHSQISYAVFCLKKKKNRAEIRDALHSMITAVSASFLPSALPDHKRRNLGASHRQMQTPASSTNYLQPHMRTQW